MKTVDQSNFSKAAMAGQRLMVGVQGTALSPATRDMIRRLHIGGIILFKRNIVDPDQVRDLCMSIQDVAASCDLPPLFIAIDQEGGIVKRLPPPFTQFAGNPFIRTEADAADFAVTTARELRQVGLNMNMAPVLDVVPEGVDGVMNKRVFGHDPDQVSLLGSVVIQQMQAGGVMAVAKHFPGIGRTCIDSHFDLPSVETTPDELGRFDLVPFRAAIAEKVSAVMLSHIRYTAMDSLWPASLSVAIARDLLRRNMGYEGVVITDDLDMGAIKKHHPMNEIVDRIIECEIDVALICHTQEDMENAHKNMMKMMTDSPNVMDKTTRSVERIMALKRQYLIF